MVIHHVIAIMMENNIIETNCYLMSHIDVSMLIGSGSVKYTPGGEIMCWCDYIGIQTASFFTCGGEAAAPTIVLPVLNLVSFTWVNFHVSWE